MSEKEMNSYRLTNMEEPTDEMLSLLMKEVAEEAKCRSEEAHRKFSQSSVRLLECNEGRLFISNSEWRI